MLGVDVERVLLDALHAHRHTLEAALLTLAQRGHRSVGGHEVAQRLTPELGLHRVPVSREVEKQAVFRVAPVLFDEALESIVEHVLIRIEDGLHGKTVFFQRGGHVGNVPLHSGKLGPVFVGAHADHERVALLVKTDGLTCRRLDLDALDAPRFSSKVGKGGQEDSQRQQQPAESLVQLGSSSHGPP